MAANPEAVRLVQAAIARNPKRGIAGVAELLKVSRPALSRYLNDGTYKGAAVEAAILARFDRYPCPWLGLEVTETYCMEFNTGPVPTWNPSALDQRRTCQTCPHAPGALPAGRNPTQEVTS